MRYGGVYRRRPVDRKRGVLVPTFVSGGATSLFPTDIPSAETFAIRTNSITNFDFETDTTGWLVGASWNLNSGATITSDASFAIRGTKSGKVVTPGVTEAEGTEYSLGILTNAVEYVAGTWVYLASGTVDLELALGERSVDQVIKSFTIGTGWTYLQTSPWTATTNNAYFCVRTRFGVSQAATFYLDDARTHLVSDTAGALFVFETLPSGIAGAEAFGTQVQTFGVAPTGIASGEAFGTASLNPAIVVTAIASAEAFGTSQVDRDLPAGSISSAEAFGDAIIDLSILPSAIASGEVIGSLEITPSINPTGIASAFTTGTARIDLIILGIGKDSDYVSGDINVSSYPIVPDSITSGETFGATVVIYTPLTAAGNFYFSDIVNETEPAVLITDGVQTNVNGNVAVMTHQFTLEGRVQIGIYIDDAAFNGSMSIYKNGALNESEEIQNVGWRYFADLLVDPGDVLDVTVANF